MEGAEGILVLVVIVVAAIAVGFILHAQSLRQANDAFARLAKKYGGRCFPAAAFQRPSVRFTYKGAAVLIDVYSTGGKHTRYYTQLHIAWPNRALRVTVRPEKILAQFGKFFGMEDIQIGSSQFDDRYLISGNDPRAIRQLLNANVQTGIEQLRRFRARDDIYFAINAGRMLVKLQGYFRDYATLARFTSQSLVLYDQTLLTTMEGIEFVGEQTEVDWTESICQICGESIQESPVFCASCKTPHHEDCWEYYGTCSTYGCGQNRFLVNRE